ncbi:MAG: hypothetical protein ACD_16C00132G0004 [uncultured bacterium]|nr:MAG: hypothetical protein ACD_16C00132G0004 [uncultured bacterium]OFW69555.1 MAG: hypothetical protein A2X70_00875 [Alphaproteobacteria bacterium GWC2_42_16]OFW74079.1 MAG: hypothetical protein A2Z80_04540 [Alphaproteobacteria bacterium GWA2_41_27]OFW84387.1 MAG: hypothetical protein A3E50_03225 [Alphaproteobacteria bacterium RIFCSPHIGHO2_12_FULL_42_100]OFW85908.1 MAG: hypothetical protein A2W06_05105 [Alphaproteobacteria bacterium RBG_16_42_14]OFW92233.1 MAG: hypothetical protein A3C41_028
MTLFRYKALGPNGIIHKGVIEASSIAVLNLFFHERHLSPISYFVHFSWPFKKKLSPKTLRDMCLHLEQFERAGVSLIESLEELAKAFPSRQLQPVLKEIINNVNAGLLLSQALAKHPRLFDRAVVGLISAGEKTGHLSETYAHLTNHLEWVDDIQAQTVKALRYPLIIAGVLTILIFCFLFFLVPEIVKFMSMASIPLPWSIEALLHISTFLESRSCVLFLLLILLSCASIGVFYFHPQGRLWKGALLESLPILGHLRKSINLVRFSHVFSLSVNNGIEILEALQITRETLKGGSLSTAIISVETFIKEGLTLSQAMEKAKAFPSFMIRMVARGEQTSCLDKSLLHIKESLETALKRRVDHLISVIEPFLIIFFALILFWLVASIFLPLYETLSTLDY